MNLLKEEIYGGEDEDMTPSVIKDMVDQIQELKMKFMERHLLNAVFRIL